MWTYRAKVIRVVDGDTVDVDIDLGFGIWQKNERVRIMGIDTPESRTRNKVEKKFGLAAKAKLQSLLGKDTVLKTTINKKGVDMKGKFGRILGDFVCYDHANDRHSTVTQILVDEGYAVKYHGQSKDDIQEAHLANRERLVKEGIISL